jgi:hypothetical protein
MKEYLSPAPSLHLGNVIYLWALPIVKHKAKVLMNDKAQVEILHC